MSRISLSPIAAALFLVSAGSASALCCILPGEKGDSCVNVPAELCTKSGEVQLIPKIGMVCANPGKRPAKCVKRKAAEDEKELIDAQYEMSLELLKEYVESNR